MSRDRSETSTQNWEDSWIIEEPKKLSREPTFTGEEPYFKKGPGVYVSKPMFFGASVKYFFARLIHWFVNLFKSSKVESNSAKVSPLVNTSTAAMCAASHKISKPHIAYHAVVKPAAEVYTEKFEDEGVVYRP